MGRRSRKRAGEPDTTSAGAATTRAERDAARKARARKASAGEAVTARPAARPGRTSFDERPPPLWGSFPLTELVILAGIVLMVWGFVSGAGEEGNARIAAGLAIAALAGLELAVREHVTGFRSHTTLLAGAVGILVVVILGLGAGLETLGVLLAAGLFCFAGSFLGLRELFRRRSGGLSFR
jgi:hypothetical protein